MPSPSVEVPEGGGRLRRACENAPFKKLSHTGRAFRLWSGSFGCITPENSRDPASTKVIARGERWEPCWQVFGERGTFSETFPSPNLPALLKAIRYMPPAPEQRTMAVGESGAAFVECKDIVFVAVQVEGQGAGEIAPEQAVHEKLADLPDAGQNPLRPGHDDPFFARHGAWM